MKRTTATFLIAALTGIGACGEEPIDPIGAGEGDDTSALFEEFDTDADGFLDEAEFGLGFAAEDFIGDLDLDADGVLSETEFGDRFGPFADFDADLDGFLDDDEFTVGAFDTFDDDGDALVDEVEFDVGLDLL